MASKSALFLTSVLANSWLLSTAVVAQAPVDDLGGEAIATPAAPPIAPAPVTPPPQVPAAVVEVAPAPVAPPPVIPAVPAPAPVAQPVEPPAPNPQPLRTAPLPLEVETAEVYIDREDYSLGATTNESVPVEIITRGQSSQENIGISKSIVRKPIPAKLPLPVNRPSVQVGSVNLSRSGVQWQPRNAAPAANSVVRPKINTYFDQTLLKPMNQVSRSLINVIFPVAVPSPITSPFGWRIHPIAGVRRLHTGTDIGAPMGTPVMAAMPGRVILADRLGGYGITVAIEHDNGTRQTLYAHMSELFVRPGDEVQQGTVIGRIGNTGASTGPHLHFELRQMMPDGTWVALDPGNHLKTAMASLIRSLQIAQQAQKTAIRSTAQPTTAAQN